jgi:hypothetical protein
MVQNSHHIQQQNFKAHPIKLQVDIFYADQKFKMVATARKMLTLLPYGKVFEILFLWKQ